MENANGAFSRRAASANGRSVGAFSESEAFTSVVKCISHN
jgi:hypothetical protein